MTNQAADRKTRCTDRQTDRQIDRQTPTHPDRSTEPVKHADGLTD